MAYTGEICQECGLPYVQVVGSFWNAPNELWNEVMGGADCKDDPGGLLCPRCFYHACRDKGIHIAYRAYEYAPRSDERAKEQT